MSEEDWGEYFRRLRAENAEKDQLVATEPPSTTASVKVEDPSELPASPRRLWKRCADIGMLVGAIIHTVHYPVEYYSADSKVTDEDGAPKSVKGDVKKEAHEKTHIALRAIHTTFKIKTTATWVDGRFQSAVCHDPVGFPVKLLADYSPSEYSIERLGKVRAEMNALRLVDAYNDGKPFLLHVMAMPKARDLDIWLEDWAALVDKSEGVAA